MPALLASRLYRIIPLIIILAIVALIIYAVASWRYTPARAKEILIALFTWLNVGLTGFFALVMLYAVLEGNYFVAEFFAWFVGTTLVALLITYICKRIFLKHNPHYQWKVNVKNVRAHFHEKRHTRR